MDDLNGLPSPGVLNSARAMIPPHSIVTVTVLILIGAVVGAFADPYLPAMLSNSKKNYQVGFDSARKLVEKSSVGDFFRTESKVNSLSGTVTAISANQLTLYSPSANPFDVPTSDERTILIASSTKILKSTMVCSNISQINLATQQTSAESIIVGDFVSVSASENIKNLTTFTAAEIHISPKQYISPKL